jgi:hypothetical protein
VEVIEPLVDGLHVDVKHRVFLSVYKVFEIS